MKTDEIKELPPDEIVSEVNKLREKIFKARFQAKGEPVENPGALVAMKRDVARLLTILRQKQGPAPRRRTASRASRLDRRARRRRGAASKMPVSGGKS